MRKPSEQSGGDAGGPREPRGTWWSLDEAAAWVGAKTGRSCSRECVRLWVTRGLMVEGGRVRLEALLIVGRWVVRPRWVKEFIKRTTAGRLAAGSPGGVAAAPAEPADRRAERFRREKAAAARALGRPAP